MDVGDPSNFARILDLFSHSHAEIRHAMNAYSYKDDELRAAIGRVYDTTGYLMDPHGAAGFLALQQHSPKEPGIPGVFLETAHPAKFSQTVEEVIGSPMNIPDRLNKASSEKKVSIPLSTEFTAFKDFLTETAH
jgi:threonine synthase